MMRQWGRDRGGDGAAVGVESAGERVGIQQGDDNDAKGEGPHNPSGILYWLEGRIIQETLRYSSEIGPVEEGANLPQESSPSESEQPKISFVFTGGRGRRGLSDGIYQSYVHFILPVSSPRPNSIIVVLIFIHWYHYRQVQCIGGPGGVTIITGIMK